MTRKLLTLTVAVWTVTGCDGDLVGSLIRQVEFTVNEPELIVDEERRTVRVTVPLTIRNTGEAPVTFQPCFVRFQRRTSSGWISIGGTKG